MPNLFTKLCISPWGELHSRPAAYEAAAIATMLQRHKIKIRTTIKKLYLMLVKISSFFGNFF